MAHPFPPRRVVIAVNRLSSMRIALACWLGLSESYPAMLSPADILRTTLCANVTDSTTHHGHLPSWLRGVKRIAYPDCACSQLFSSRLYSTVMRRAFFSSKMFLICQRSF